ncbi:peptidase S11 [Prosthecochloris sp. GSB1]|nr:peptidase S11 [Prosthecochloris sp. GSB1]
MKRTNVFRLAAFLPMLFAFAAGPCLFASAAEDSRLDTLDPSKSVASYILKDVGTSRVLMSRNTGKKIQPASLTKILTCIIAIESGKLGNVVEIPREATLVEPTKAGFDPGEKIRLVDLVKASMVRSSNDAAFAIAVYLGGSVSRFAVMMNRRAKEIGMTHSHFTNPAGYDRDLYEGHYSTAEDLLRLTEYAIDNELFNRIARLDSVSFLEQKTRKRYTLKSSNKLLERYPYAVGIKTGYTFRAGRCLIARAMKGDRDMVLVMLNAGKDRWEMAQMMFEKAFAEKTPRGAVSSARHDPGKPLTLYGNELE